MGCVIVKGEEGAQLRRFAPSVCGLVVMVLLASARASTLTATTDPVAGTIGKKRTSKNLTSLPGSSNLCNHDPKP